MNGPASIDIPRPVGEGLRIRGVNGALELRVSDALNADLEVSGHNGRVSVDAPNVTMREQVSRTRMRARIGAGGPQISVSGINGRVSLNRG